MRLFVASLLASILSSAAHAGEIHTMNSSVRALGMGDAFTALATDSSSLFYNPAGLARTAGFNWKIMSLRAGASGLEAYEKIQDIQGSGAGDEFADAIKELYGEHVWTGVGVETAFTAPMFGAAIYNHTDLMIKVDNPVYPEVYTGIVNDYGYTMGLGVPISPFMHWGLGLRYVKRSGARIPWGGAAIADLNPDDIIDNVTGWGRGYGVDTGVNFFVPTPLFGITLAAAWKNIGRMSFRSNDPNTHIPYEENDVTVGAAFIYDTPFFAITPAIDFRYLNVPDYQLMRKINFGVEVNLPLLDIRGGFREGYYTYGVGLNLGLFRVDAATYGVELGEYPGQIEDRRYVLEFTMELGVGNFQAGAQPPGDSFGGGGDGGGSSAGGGGSGGSSKSIWGGRRLKQRR